MTLSVPQTTAATRDLDTAREGIRAMLRLLGADPDDPGLIDTPDRWVRAYFELGFAADEPAEVLSRTFTQANVDQVVFVGPIRFVSLCEHHLLPFEGKAWVAYKPTNDTVVGLSKLPRLVLNYARRPQLQERLTGQITEAIMQAVPCTGAACLIEAEHTCMTMRGVRAEGAKMKTSSLLGIFRKQGKARSEFFSMVETSP